jgi:hypothetical protein
MNLMSKVGLFLLLENAKKNGTFILINASLLVISLSTNKIKWNDKNNATLKKIQSKTLPDWKENVGKNMSTRNFGNN